MARHGEKKRRMDHPLPDPLTEEQWEQVRQDFSFPPRQFEVVRLLCRACSDTEIAAIVGIDSNTVRMHVRRALERLNVRTRVGIVTMIAAQIRGASPDDDDEGALE